MNKEYTGRNAGIADSFVCVFQAVFRQQKRSIVVLVTADLTEKKRDAGRMLEDHSVGLIIAGVVSGVVYVFGLIVNVSDLVLHYSDSPLIPDILHVGFSNATSFYTLPVSLADWSRPVWGVVYGCQSIWLLFSLVNYFRQTATGPAYNNPKVLPVPVHVFFSLAVLTQTGWLVMVDRNYILFALVLVFMSASCAVISVCESYRALTATLPILQSQERTGDVWAIRLLVQNPLAFFATWVILHGTLTFGIFLTFGMDDHSVLPQTGSLVQLVVAAFLMFVYVLMDLTALDQYSRFVVMPYLGFVLFHAAQLNKDWPSVHSPIFIMVASLTAFSFIVVFVKVVAMLCRHVPQCEGDLVAMNIVTRPLASDLEEETYLLREK